jgi:hypothetical protein
LHHDRTQESRSKPRSHLGQYDATFRLCRVLPIVLGKKFDGNRVKKSPGEIPGA